MAVGRAIADPVMNITNGVCLKFNSIAYPYSRSSLCGNVCGVGKLPIPAENENILSENLVESDIITNFASQTDQRGVNDRGIANKTYGSMSEWLGTGLQNRLHQFESGWNLTETADILLNISRF